MTGVAPLAASRSAFSGIPGHRRDRVAALDQRVEHRRPDVPGGAG